MKNALIIWIGLAFLLVGAGTVTGAAPETAGKRPPEAEEGS
jgi:hypothetical protein